MVVTHDPRLGEAGGQADPDERWPHRTAALIAAVVTEMRRPDAIRFAAVALLRQRHGRWC